MKVILYNNNAERSKVNKTLLLTNPIEYNGTLREECSITNPIIEFQHVGVITSNYAYIEEFNRYYFIDEVVSVRNNLWRVSMVVDVLMSFKDDINNVQGIVSRQEFEYNPLLKDDLLPLKLSRKLQHIYGVMNYDNIFRGVWSGKEQHCYALCVFSGVGLSYSSGENNILEGATLSHSPFNVSCQIYALTYTELEDFLKEISSFDFGAIFLGEKSDYIISVRVYPNDLAQGANISNDQRILINKRYMVTKGYELLPKTIVDGNNIVSKEGLFEVINVKQWTSDVFTDKKFLLYPPYTDCKLYLPYYGMVDFDFKSLNTELNGKSYDSIGIYISFDYMSGQASYSIYPIEWKNGQATKLGAVPINTYTFNLGVDVPISSNREATVKNNLILSSVKTAINAGLAIGGIPLSMEQTKASYSKRLDRPTKKAKKMGEYAGIQAGLDSANIATNYIDSVLQAMSYNPSTYEGDGFINYSHAYFPCLILNMPVIEEPNDYAHLYGRPSMTNDVLSNLNGFTVMANFHLDNFPYCLNEELEEIEQLLKEGVIL